MRIFIEKKVEKTTLSQFVVVLLSIILAFITVSIIFIFLGKNPLEVLKELIGSAFFTDWGLIDTLINAIPLMLIGLGLVIAFKMELWNIGGEGQFYLGAIAATWVALFFLKGAGSWVVIPGILISGFLAGALWGGIAGVLKAFIGVNEIVSTLMLNYIAILFCDYLVYGPWRDPAGYNFPLTEAFPPEARLADLFHSGIHSGLVFSIILAVLVYYYLNRTKIGFEMKVIGANEKTARYAGINIRKNIVLAMLLSGGIAGLAGAVQMAGVQHQLQHGFSPGYGFTAIIVAWLARLNPYVTLLVAFLLGGLFVGGEQIQLFMRIPHSIVNVLQAIILFFILAGEVLNNYQIKISREDKQVEEFPGGGGDNYGI